MCTYQVGNSPGDRKTVPQARASISLELLVKKSAKPSSQVRDQLLSLEGLWRLIYSSTPIGLEDKLTRMRLCAKRCEYCTHNRIVQIVGHDLKTSSGRSIGFIAVSMIEVQK